MYGNAIKVRWSPDKLRPNMRNGYENSMIRKIVK